MVWSGCSREAIDTVGPVEQAERDSLLVELDAVSQDAMRAAFGNLEQFAYRRYLRTEQFDGEDFVMAYTEHLIDVEGAGEDRISRVTQADSGGAFDYGFFNQFVSENVDDTDPADLVPYLLEENPSYLNPRNLDKYAFQQERDTLMWDRSAKVFEIIAKPELADGLNVRRVRYYIDVVSNELVAMYLERIDLGMLFREESTFYMHIRPVAGGVLVPYNTRFQTLIRTPFKGAYRIRTVSTYTDHRTVAGFQSMEAAADSTG